MGQYDDYDPAVPHEHPHWVSCRILSKRNTRCWNPCGHPLPHEGGGEYWDNDREDVPAPPAAKPEASTKQFPRPPLDIARELESIGRTDLAHEMIQSMKFFDPYGPANSRQRLLNMASELARLAVELTAATPDPKTTEVGASIDVTAQQLLHTLPRCTKGGELLCNEAATYRAVYPLDRGGEWLHACDAHVPEGPGEDTSGVSDAWVELPYAVPLRGLTRMLKPKGPPI